MTALNGLKWRGGKSSGRGNTLGTGQWIASLLPPVEPRQTYIEPFAGMLGVLLQRAPAFVEIVNDLDGRVINWWRAVRDEPDELARLVALTPHSRAEYQRAIAAVNDGGPQKGVGAALDFTIAVLQSVRASPESGPNQWNFHVAPTRARRWYAGLPDNVAALAERMARVTLEQRDACELLERTAPVESTIIYVDPPYPTAVRIDYGGEVDLERLGKAMLAQQGRVAVSGYGSEWDHLGWERHEWSTHIRLTGSGVNERTEVLWTNYEPPRRLL